MFRTLRKLSGPRKPSKSRPVLEPLDDRIVPAAISAFPRNPAAILASQGRRANAFGPSRAAFARFAVQSQGAVPRATLAVATQARFNAQLAGRIAGPRASFNAVAVTPRIAPRVVEPPESYENLFTNFDPRIGGINDAMTNFDPSTGMFDKGRFF